MKKRIFNFVALAVSLLSLTLCLSGCIFDNVVPCAWVKLDMEGYVYYRANMYASGGNHIELYESQEEFDSMFPQTLIEIVFYPRILGAYDTEDEGRVTTVDVSRPNQVSMTVIINKLPENSLYSPSKKVYLNGELLVSNPEYDYNSDAIVSWMFDNVPLVRGNPNGQFNEFINKLEYK